MRAGLIALSLLAAGTLAAHAEDGTLLWKSPAPAGYVTSGERCYATVRLIRGKRYFNQMECHTPDIHNYVSMSWPMDEPPINMTGVKEAAHVRVLPGGTIQLY